MVKVVDPTPQPDVVKFKSCTNCGVKLSYVPADLQKRKHTDYSGDTDYWQVIVCPACNADVKIRNY